MRSLISEKKITEEKGNVKNSLGLWIHAVNSRHMCLCYFSWWTFNIKYVFAIGNI